MQEITDKGASKLSELWADDYEFERGAENNEQLVSAWRMRVREEWKRNTLFPSASSST